MQYTAREIAALIGGEIIGNPEAKVHTLCKIEEGKEGAISFLGNLKFEEYIYNSKASIILINQDFTPQKEVAATLIKVKDAYAAFGMILNAYNSKTNEHAGVSEQSSVSTEAHLSDNVTIGAFSVVSKNANIGKNTIIYSQVFIGENVTIGENCVIYPGVKIYANSILHNNIIIHANAVIGADGFGYTRDENKVYTKLPQIGNVIIHDNVEIGANTTVDSATIGSTVVHQGVKIDNLVQVAHNVEIGEHTAIASFAGLSGSTTIGKRCIIAGQAGFAGHLEIGDDSIVGAQAGVSKSFPNPKTILLGSPAYEASETKRIFAVTRRLPDLTKKVASLEAELEALKKQLQG